MQNLVDKNKIDTETLKKYLALWLMPEFKKSHWRLLLKEGFVDINSQIEFLANSDLTKISKSSKRQSGFEKIAKNAQIILSKIDALPYKDLVYKHLSWLDSHKKNFIIPFEYFPKSLKHIEDVPMLLSGIGDPNMLNENSIAVVGSRNATSNAKKIAYNFSADFAKKDLLVVSGLALGIDGEAHKGALSTGKTLAVMATGIDVIYPKIHINLAREIVRDGAIITEMPLGTAPLPGLFPVRNRIITGISLATFVVEASLKSGSLISARLANEAGRSVYAAPSMLNNPQTMGTNRLIQEGATIVLESEDILRDLEPQINSMENSQEFDFKTAKNLRLNLKNINNSSKISLEKSSSAENLPKELKKIWDKLGTVGLSTDELCKETNMEVAQVQIILMQLELKGLIEQIGGGWIKIL